MEKIFDQIVKAFRKKGTGIIPMEGGTSANDADLFVTIDGKGYSIKITRNEAYDDLPEENVG